MKFYDIINLKPAYVGVQEHGSNFKEMPIYKNYASNKKVCVTFVNKDDGSLGIEITALRPFKQVMITWKIDEFTVGAKVTSDSFERSYGSLRWEKREDTRIFPWYIAVSDKTNTFAYGVKTGCHTLCSWITQLNAVSLVIDCRNGAYPIHLNRDRVLYACDVVQIQNNPGEAPFDTLRRFATFMCPNPRLPKAPVYGANDWYYAYLTTNQELMKMDADLLAECTKGLENRPYCVLDNGWMDVRMNPSSKFDPKQTWNPDTKKFPDMNELTKYIHDKDMKAGIWFRPLMASLHDPLKTKMPDILSRLSPIESLDPSVPETLEYVKSTIRKIKGWGFDLIKHDFSTFDIFGKFHREHFYASLFAPLRHFRDRTKTTAEIILNFYNAIREAAGDDMIVIGCNTIPHLAAGIFELQRTGEDTSGIHFKKTVKMGVNTLAFNTWKNDIFFGCDADCIGHKNLISWSQNREWLNLLALSGTPLFTSIDPRLVTDEIKEDLKNAYKIASTQSSKLQPVDWFDTITPSIYKDENGKEYQFNWRK